MTLKENYKNVIVTAKQEDMYLRELELPSNDNRRNPRIIDQWWVEQNYIDNESMQRYLRMLVQGKYSVYGFCGQENYCTVNVDADPRSKANVKQEFFTYLDTIEDESVDVFITDPLFVFEDDQESLEAIYKTFVTLLKRKENDLEENYRNTVSKLFTNKPVKDGFLNANKAHWENAMRKYGLQEDVIEKAKSSRLWGHNMEWQREVYNKIKPGGVSVMKRNIANVNTMAKIPQMFYVFDSRPSAHIVRFDWKFADENEIRGRTRI